MVELTLKPRIAELIADEAGIWRTCSGCHESEDGHDVGYYPRSDVFQCKLGGGCRECGGIGAVWDTTDWDDMARSMIAADARIDTPPSSSTESAEKETLDYMREIANDLGYPSVLEALEDLERRRAAPSSTPEVVEALEWIGLFADVRSKDDSKTFARVNRGALRTIRDEARAAIAALPPSKSDIANAVSFLTEEKQRLLIGEAIEALKEARADIDWSCTAIMKLHEQKARHRLEQRLIKIDATLSKLRGEG